MAKKKKLVFLGEELRENSVYGNYECRRATLIECLRLGEEGTWMAYAQGDLKRFGGGRKWSDPYFESQQHALDDLERVLVEEFRRVGAILGYDVE